MPNRNGQGPMGAGSGTGRGRGLCKRSNQPGLMDQDDSSSQVAVESQRPDTGCRGPQGCGTGNQRRKNGCGGGRSQR